MKKVVLSICMMIKNEEKNLRRCLDSLQPLRESIPSELIIVDTGSEDNSIAIAKEYTDKVYTHPWNNDFSEIRNITISYAQGEWVFILDADEELESAKGIIDFFATPIDKEIGAAALTGKNLTTEDDKNHFASVLTIRIFRRTSTFHYEGAVHNIPVIEGNVFDTGASILHYGFLSHDKELMERKFQRTSQLLKEELKKDPDNIYYWYQLGNSYTMYENWRMALPILVKAYDMIRYKSREERKQYIFVDAILVLAYIRNEIYDNEVIEIAKNALEYEPDYVDLHCFLAKIYLYNEDYINAKKYYEKYLQIMNDFDNAKSRLNLSITHYTLHHKVEAIFNLANIAMHDKDYDQANLLFFKVINEYSDEKVFVALSREGIAKCDFENKNFSNCYEVYCKLIAKELFVEAKEFEAFLESMWKKLDIDAKVEYAKQFSDVEGAYGYLNCIRVSKKINDVEFLLTLNWNELPEYYAFTWIYSLKYYEKSQGSIIEKYWSCLSEENLMIYMKYMVDANLEGTLLDICESFIAYKDYIGNYQLIRMRKNVLKFILFSTVQYELYFKEYVEEGISFIKQLYGETIICNEWIAELKNVEEVFFLYMSLAKKCTVKDRIKYLNKANDVFPEMKEGIRLLLEEMLEKTPVEKARDQEMANLKKNLLEHITKLINEKKFYEALQVIEEAERVLGNDLEILSLKSEIAVKNT